MLKPTIIALALLTATSPALANSKKLPFTGTKYFNFMGGTGTVMSLTITKKGNATVKYHGTVSTETSYRGKYRNPLPDGDGGYLQIKGNNIYLMDENKNYVYDCMGNGDVCASTLHRLP